MNTTWLTLKYLDNPQPLPPFAALFMTRARPPGVARSGRDDRHRMPSVQVLAAGEGRVTI
jgi:hypothetical protein